MTSVRNSVEEPIYQIKVTLKNSKPPIWRRLLVPSESTLGDLHHMIQAAFGWWDYHLHQFEIDGTYYGEPHPDYFDYVDMHDEQDVTLRQITAGEGFRFDYEYDFGDSWLHQVLVEKILAPEPGLDYPVCIKGRRACPPEDVGGMWGYYNFLDAIADPDHEEHEEYLEWVGGPFDPDAFDLEEVNQALSAYRRGFTPRQAAPGSGFVPEWTLSLTDRSVAIIKPRQPLVDWVNRIVPLSTPLSLELVQQDCTAIVVPDLGDLEATLEYLEPVKPLLLEMELEGWDRDPSDWPEELTAELFDAWFDLEVHSFAWQLTDVPAEGALVGPTDLSGTWMVTASPDTDEDDLYGEATPHLTLDQDALEVGGELQFGQLNGTLSGRWVENLVLFGFEGSYRSDPVNGVGLITLAGDVMMLQLMLHQGGTFTFMCYWAEDGS
jgi:hypothetical protein